MTILYLASHDPSRDDSFRLALDVARSLSAGIRLLYVVDGDEIRRREAGAPPGAIYIAREAEEEIVRRESSEGAEVLAGLSRECREAGVPFTAAIKAGSPDEEVEKQAARCDLCVAGVGSQRSSDSDAPDPEKMVAKLVKARIIPILLATAPYRPVRTVVVGCSGALHGTRAVGAMARLGLWKKDCRLVLAAADETPEKGRARLEEAREILGDAGYPPWEEKVLPEPKTTTFPQFVEEADADAIVFGGWGKHHWDDLFRHSLTGHFLSTRRHHLFLYM